MNHEASKRSAVEFSFYCVRILDIDPHVFITSTIYKIALIKNVILSHTYH